MSYQIQIQIQLTNGDRVRELGGHWWQWASGRDLMSIGRYAPWRISGDAIILTPNFASSFKASHVTTWLVEILCYVAFKGSTAIFGNIVLLSRVSCKKGLTRHAYAWQIGPFWQDTLVIWWLCKVEDAELWSLLTWLLGSPFHSLP